MRKILVFHNYNSLPGCYFFHFFICILLLSFTTYSQTDSLFKNLSNKKLLHYAEKSEKEGNYEAAIKCWEYYGKNLKRNQERTIFKLAELYRKTDNYLKAESLYKILATNNPSGYPEAIYYLARMQKRKGDCDSAIINFRRFKAFAGEREYLSVKEEIDKEKNACRLKDSLAAKGSDVVAFRLDSTINGTNTEFSPIILNDTTLIYGSLVVGQGQQQSIKRFYQAKYMNNLWIGGIELKGGINSNHIPVGNGALSPDGERFYFSRCGKNMSGKIKCSLFVSRLIDENWSDPESLPGKINSGNYMATQPATATDSKPKREIIYFVSDRPGGKGGSDIWFTVFDKIKNEYSDPQNCGGRINTSSNENTPFYHIGTHSLFFSSDGHPSLGGFDLFKSYGEKKNWNSPQNIGYPYNSGADDLYYVLNKNSQEGFFVSNRVDDINTDDVQSCCDDIFYFKNRSLIRINVKGTVLALEAHAFGQKPDSVQKLTDTVEGALVSLYMVDTLSQETFFIESIESGKKGQFEFDLDPGNKYHLIAEKDKYLNGSTGVSTKKIMASATLHRIIYITPIPEKPIVLENIYYEFDRYELTERSKVVLDSILIRILNENPEIKIDVLSHTDSKGEDKYNLKLSQKRAESVIRFLIDKGINKNRLTAIGYGERMPVVPNTNPDGSDNPEGREKNRRTEFKIIKK